MPKFTVCIEEMISQEFELEAKDGVEALELGQEKYKTANLYLSQVILLQSRLLL